MLSLVWSGQKTSSVKGKMVSHTVSVVTTQLCCERLKAAKDNTQMYGHSCIPQKFYLQRQAARFGLHTKVSQPLFKCTMTHLVATLSSSVS